MPNSGFTARALEATPIDFREIFQQHGDYVLRTLRFLGVGPSDLEDVAHDVFLHVHRHLAAYDPTRPLRPWLYVFAYRIARDFRKLSRHRETTADFLWRCADEGPGPDVQLMRQQMQALALRALDVLEPDERGVFVAVTLDELSAPEVAEAMELPVNTVYSRLRRARAKFDAEVHRLSTKPRRS